MFCRDLVVGSVLARVAKARVIRELELRTEALSKHPPPYGFTLGRYHDPRVVAVMNVYEEAFAFPEPERIDSSDLQTVSLATAMVRFRKLVLVDAAQRALDGHALTSAKLERSFFEGALHAIGVSVDEVAVLALVSDLLIAEIDHTALDTKTRELLLGSESIVKRRISDASPLAELVKLYDQTLGAIYGIWVSSRHHATKAEEPTKPEARPRKRTAHTKRPRKAIETMGLTDAELLVARDILELLRLYRQKLARGRQPSRQQAQRTRSIER